MKKILSLLLCAILCLAMVPMAFAADTVVYVNDGGAGDGFSENAPLGDLTAAYELVTDGGKIVITDTYTLPENFREPEHAGNIVVTGGTLVFTDATSCRYYMSGKGSTTFENMKIECLNDACLFVAQYNKLIMGEGLEMTRAALSKCYVAGGYQCDAYPVDAAEVDFSLDSDVTIKSGTYYIANACNRGASGSVLTGTGHLNIYGGTFTKIFGASINGTYSQNSVVNIYGGTIGELWAAGDATRRLNGDSTINIFGGEIKTMTINNVCGKANVGLYGGTVGSAAKLVASQVAEFVTDGSLTLTALNTMDIENIKNTFDTVVRVNEIPKTGTEVKMTVNSTTAYVNGEAKTLDAAPIIRQNRTMLPVRFVAENLGATVAWDGATSTATVTGNGVTIEITIGATSAKVNGEAVALDSPAFIENSRTYLPVRFVAERLGATVAWDGATSTATLTK